MLPFCLTYLIETYLSPCRFPHSLNQAGLLPSGCAISLILSLGPWSSAWRQAEGQAGLRGPISWGLVDTYKKQPLIWREMLVPKHLSCWPVSVPLGIDPQPKRAHIGLRRGASICEMRRHRTAAWFPSCQNSTGS